MKQLISAAAIIAVAAFAAGCDRPVTKESASTTVVERDKTAAAPNVTVTPPASPAPETKVESKTTDVQVTPPSADAPGTASKTETTTSTTK